MFFSDEAEENRSNITYGKHDTAAGSVSVADRVDDIESEEPATTREYRTRNAEDSQAVSWHIKDTHSDKLANEDERDLERERKQHKVLRQSRQQVVECARMQHLLELRRREYTDEESMASLSPSLLGEGIREGTENMDRLNKSREKQLAVWQTCGSCEVATGGEPGKAEAEKYDNEAAGEEGQENSVGGTVVGDGDGDDTIGRRYGTEVPLSLSLLNSAMSPVVSQFNLSASPPSLVEPLANDLTKVKGEDGLSRGEIAFDADAEEEKEDSSESKRSFGMSSRDLSASQMAHLQSLAEQNLNLSTKMTDFSISLRKAQLEYDFVKSR